MTKKLFMRTAATVAAACLSMTAISVNVWPRPAEPASGSRQLPGNVQIPSDIATAPTVTKAPPRPIRVPSDIATVSTVSQGNELAS